MWIRELVSDGAVGCTGQTQTELRRVGDYLCEWLRLREAQRVLVVQTVPLPAPIKGNERCCAQRKRFLTTFSSIAIINLVQDANIQI